MDGNRRERPEEYKLINGMTRRGSVSLVREWRIDGGGYIGVKGERERIERLQRTVNGANSSRILPACDTRVAVLTSPRPNFEGLFSLSLSLCIRLCLGCVPSLLFRWWFVLHSLSLSLSLSLSFSLSIYLCVDLLESSAYVNEIYIYVHVYIYVCMYVEEVIYRQAR